MITFNTLSLTRGNRIVVVFVSCSLYKGLNLRCGLELYSQNWFASQIACITMLLLFSLLKKSLVAIVTLLLGSDANGIWIPCMALQILDKLIRSWKWFVIFCKWSLDGILIYLLNNLFLSHTLYHVFHYGWCSHIELIGHVCGTSFVNQPINYNGYNFSYLYLSNKVCIMGWRKQCQFLD